jgi:hypothetical protein
MNDARQHDRGHHASRRSQWVLVGFLLTAAFFLWTEHRAHLLGILPYLLLAACPLMHLFHHGHGHHDSDRPDAGNVRPNREETGEQP